MTKGKMHHTSNVMLLAYMRREFENNNINVTSKCFRHLCVLHEPTTDSRMTQPLSNGVISIFTHIPLVFMPSRKKF